MPAFSISGLYNYLLLISGTADTSCLYVYLSCVVDIAVAMWDGLLLHVCTYSFMEYRN